MLNKYLPTKLCKRPKVPRTLFPFQNTESLQISKKKKNYLYLISRHKFPLMVDFTVKKWCSISIKDMVLLTRGFKACLTVIF
jgi:hypothetical protein